MLKRWMLWLPLVALGCCQEPDQEQTAVERYVDLLQTNQYEAQALPDFSEQNIGELLRFKDDTNRISRFPRNPISSLYLETCQVGVYVLWTIESIRLAANRNTSAISGFPSQNPVLKLRNAEALTLVDDPEAYQIASASYAQWWQLAQQTSFEAQKAIDPLADTDYAWH